ncbi:uncharacterized protein [Drosophila kikkawai]|uniref:Uncharacterized protein isoform X2 n=1 Tax=Drosophila kikkawai TaxID=30033 RepID=A0A6P4IN25_DROKI|nr:uncharacterized protein LOC108076489 isoform X2 [Drosophila kikkawai]
MTSTQIATTCCRPITKLVVSIGSGETHIIYADDSARSFCTNPSWCTFRGGLMDLSLRSEPAGKDYFKETTAFLERHFGRKPTVRASQASQQRLVSLQLNALEAHSDGNVEEEEKKERIIWHSWLLEEVELPPSQSAAVIEWIAPRTESLKISHRSWHLQNCMAWRLIVSHKNELAKCASNDSWTRSTLLSTWKWSWMSPLRILHLRFPG